MKEEVLMQGDRQPHCARKESCALLFVAFFIAASLWPYGEALAQQKEVFEGVAYRDVPWIGSRNIIWIVAQLHLLLGGFVLGVPLFAWVCEIVGWKTKEARYDKLAKEFTKLLTSAYATTALFGGIFLFLLIALIKRYISFDG